VLPVFLLVLDRMAESEGSIEALGVRLSFAAALARPAVEVPANMGVRLGVSIADTVASRSSRR
jgi:hypothetical protein